ncbi:MAG: FtsQ-type POTRA domain-containing protein [Ruminococcus sp.]|nr:FtsQ-type POTRA domain-containing protein [Ruminococcus sp.]
MSGTTKGRPGAKKRPNIRVFYALAAVIAAMIVLILCMTVFFNITEVRVEGVSVYKKDQIVNIGGIVKEMNLVRTDVHKAEQRLKDNLVYIDDVTVKKSYPSSVVISCKEAVKAADISYDDGYYVLSESGRILESANPEPTGGILVIEGFSFYQGADIEEKMKYEMTEKEAEEFRKSFRQPGNELQSEDGYSHKIVTDLLSELREQGYKNVVDINIGSRADIRINIDDRIEIKMGSSADIEYKLSYFRAVMGSLAEDYEGTLIYNGAESGVSAIPKDKNYDRPRLSNDSRNSSGADSSSAEDLIGEQGTDSQESLPASTEPDDGGGQYYYDPGYDPGYTDPGYYDPGYYEPGYYDPNYNDPGYYDGYDQGGQWDQGGGYQDYQSWDNNYGW